MSSLQTAAVEELRNRMRGPLITPDDNVYEQARKVFNAMIDRRPAVIARCADAADVIAGVRFAADQNLPLAVRGGGHNGAGLGTVDDGIVIDLGGMRSVHVDPAKRMARVEGGCLLGDVDHATHAFGLATPFGINATTGVGGLTLGGGIGLLTRKLGLSIDNLVAADVVLADGSLVTASTDEHPDLFWALRGGGGNFGVVTSFLFKLHPISMVYAGPMFWTLDKVSEAMCMWWDAINSGAEDLGGYFAYHVVPPGPPFPEQYHNKHVGGVVWCYTGPLDRAEEVLRPFRRFGPPAIDLVGPMPYPVAQRMFDALFVPGYQWYWKADFVRDLPDEAVDLNIQHASQIPNFLSGTHLYPINGAAHRVGQADTAFSYREATYCQVMVGVTPDPAENERVSGWAREYWSAMHPYSAGGAYVNMMMEEGQERVRAAYRENYDRLAQIKAQYDPYNLFHVNQNIKPAAINKVLPAQKEDASAGVPLS